MKNFVMIGAGGFVAPRHLKAIRDTGNTLVAALDKHDSVGILDSYFPSADFFTEFERFDRHCEKLKREGKRIDYVSVCSPNYLHDAHIRFGLRIGADVICEKPVVLNPWNVDALLDIEKETNQKAFTLLQLRYHPAMLELKKKVDTSASGKRYKVELSYITARGNWYHTSWKGDENKSGGIATNIGLHFFDILCWIFGDVQSNTVHEYGRLKAAGYLSLEKADVQWLLGIDEQLLPKEVLAKGERVFRFLNVDGEAINFTEGFSDLHTAAYEQLIKGNGIPLPETRKTIQLVHDIRNQLK